MGQASLVGRPTLRAARSSSGWASQTSSLSTLPRSTLTDHRVADEPVLDLGRHIRAHGLATATSDPEVTVTPPGYRLMPRTRSHRARQIRHEPIDRGT